MSSSYHFYLSFIPFLFLFIPFYPIFIPYLSFIPFLSFFNFGYIRSRTKKLPHKSTVGGGSSTQQLVLILLLPIYCVLLIFKLSILAPFWFLYFRLDAAPIFCSFYTSEKLTLGSFILFLFKKWWCRKKTILSFCWLPVDGKMSQLKRTWYRRYST